MQEKCHIMAQKHLVKWCALHAGERPCERVKANTEFISRKRTAENLTTGNLVSTFWGVN